MYLPYSSSYRTLNATLKQCNGFLHSKSAHLHQRMPNFAILMGSDYVLSTYIFITRVALYDLSREHSVHLLKNSLTFLFENATFKHVCTGLSLNKNFSDFYNWNVVNSGLPSLTDK